MPLNVSSALWDLFFVPFLHVTGHDCLLSESDVTYLALKGPKLLVEGAYVLLEARVLRILFRA